MLFTGAQLCCVIKFRWHYLAEWKRCDMSNLLCQRSLHCASVPDVNSSKCHFLSGLGCWLCVCGVRLGSLSCQAEPSDLLAYKGSEAFSVIWDVILNCTQDGLTLPSHLVRSSHVDLGCLLYFLLLIWFAFLKWLYSVVGISQRIFQDIIIVIVWS